MSALAWILTSCLLATTGVEPAHARIAQEHAARATPASRDRISKRCEVELHHLVSETLPGASAAIVLPDGSELTITAGFAWREEEREMLASDRLLSGSVGKTYVSAATLHLAQAGKISLEDSVGDHLGDTEWFSELPNGEDLTIHHLLNHSSGIPRYVFKPKFWEDLLEDRDKHWKPEELLAYVLGDKPLFPAGEGWAYSDTNFILVGMILEQASEQTFYEYVREHLLEPHDLEDTIPSDSRTIEGLAQGYVTSGKQFGLPDRVIEDGLCVFNPQFEWCGGGFAGTPLDLARWAKVLYSGDAFDGPYLDQLLETVAADPLGPGKRYGMGVIVTPSGEGAILGHEGFMPGYLSVMGYFPELEIAVALQANGDDSRAVGKPLTSVLAGLATIVKEELAR